MFGFLNPSVRDASDPVVSPQSAAAWLREMPSLDIVARQQLVLRAFEGMRQSRRPVDFARAHAMQYVHAALGACCSAAEPGRSDFGASSRPSTIGITAHNST